MNVVEYKAELPEGFSGVIKVRNTLYEDFLEVQERLSEISTDDPKKIVKQMRVLKDWAPKFIVEINLKHEEGGQITSLQEGLDDPDTRDFFGVFLAHLAAGIKRPKKSQMVKSL